MIFLHHFGSNNTDLTHVLASQTLTLLWQKGTAALDSAGLGKLAYSTYLMISNANTTWVASGSNSDTARQI